MAITQPAIIRIKKRKNFVAAANKGNKVVATTLVLQAYPVLPAEEATSRVGFTVTKRVGNAVVRNRVRRRLKAAAHELLAENAQSGWDYVFIGRLRALEEDFSVILRDMRYAIRKVTKLEAERSNATKPQSEAP